MKTFLPEVLAIIKTRPAEKSKRKIPMKVVMQIRFCSFLVHS
jgi:hypothetical protein